MTAKSPTIIPVLVRDLALFMILFFFLVTAHFQCKIAQNQTARGLLGSLSKVMLEKMTGMADGKARALARAHQAEATAQVSSLSALFTCVSCFSFSFFPPLGPRASAIVCTHALHRKQLVHFLVHTSLCFGSFWRPRISPTSSSPTSTAWSGTWTSSRGS